MKIFLLQHIYIYFSFRFIRSFVETHRPIFHEILSFSCSLLGREIDTEEHCNRWIERIARRDDHDRSPLMPRLTRGDPSVTESSIFLFVSPISLYLSRIDNTWITPVAISSPSLLALPSLSPPHPRPFLVRFLLFLCRLMEGIRL